jgi:3'-phosphoadenosine 5'-phosphosulfate sulfotransferase (PAPS reductase)/FAD synthetase
MPSSDESLDVRLNDRVAAIRRIVSGRVVFTTSFGIEDQAIAHAIFSQGLVIDVVALDTGRLFPETFEVWARTEQRYGRRILAAYPDRTGVEPLVGHQGINGFYASVEARHACCAVRKVEPLRRALAGAVAWITGLRADQSDARVGASFAIVAPRHRLFKVKSAIRLEPRAGARVHPGARHSLSSFARPRLRFDRLRTLYARRGTWRAGAHRAMVVGAGTDRRAGAA